MPTPAFVIEDLQARWKTQYLPGSSCAWASFTVGAPAMGTGTAVASPRQALIDSASDAGTCGPTVYLGPGRYDDTALIITKPTILVGGPGTIVSATIASAAGAPLWIQDVEIDDAPYPGALFVSHPTAETTLVGVTIRGATGFGVLHNGGYLSLYDSTISDTKVTSDPYSDRRVDPLQIRSGFGQPAAGAGRFVAPPDVRLGEVIDRLRPHGRAGPNIDSYVTAYTDPVVMFAPVDLSTLDCVGVGLRLTEPTLAELGDVALDRNLSAGLVDTGALAIAAYVTATENGLLHPDADPAVDAGAYSDGPICIGGITVRDHGVLFAEHVRVDGNAPVGLAGVVATMAIGGFRAHANPSWGGGSTWGDGAFAKGESFLSLDHVDVADNRRVGVLYLSSVGTVRYGTITRNQIGLLIDDSSVFHDDELDVSDNAGGDVLENGQLSVPTEPPDTLPF